MPIKTCTCSVCGETVNKAQTYATNEKDAKGFKRACKKHEGMQEIRDQRVADTVAATAQAIATKQAKKEPKKKQLAVDCTCMCCGGKLKRKKEWFFEKMMAGMNVTTHPTELMQMAINEVAVPFFLNELSDHNRQKALIKFPFKDRKLIDATGFAVCCQNCIETMCLVKDVG